MFISNGQLQCIIFHFKNKTIFRKLSILFLFKKEKIEDGSIMWIANEEISSTIENRKKKLIRKLTFNFNSFPQILQMLVAGSIV